MTPSTLEDFERECVGFFEANAPRQAEGAPFVWGEGLEAAVMFGDFGGDAEDEQRRLAEAKAWRAKRFEAGLGWISGPPEFGGRGLTQAHERIYAAVESQFVVPDQTVYVVGLGMVAPTILAHGTDVAKDRYLTAMHRGDVIGCQLFSEPNAGSDLAALACRAERDGDEWVVNGQKVWTSSAHVADIGEILCRTDVDRPKHRGITAFLVDMHAPGVTVRSIKQMNGGTSFNEVFLDGVRIPDDHRLGAVDDGWSVALTTLSNERASVGVGSTEGAALQGVTDATWLMEMLRHFGVEQDPLLRQKLARVYIGFRVAALNNRRAMAKVKAGQAPGPELSGSKLALTENLRAVADFVGAVLGPRLAADTGEWGTFAWSRFVTAVPGLRVAGGTDEVQRKIIAEQVLGLPREPGADAKIPFRDIPKG